jgi:hypothetical protein
MKNFTIYSVVVFCMLGLISMAQNQSSQLSKSITNPETGSTQVFEAGQPASPIIPGSIIQPKDAEINWQFTDAAAIGAKVRVSSETGQTFAEWWLNDKRNSLYEDSNSPVWENMVDTEWEWPMDMTPDGAWSACGFDTVAQVFNTTSSNIYWEVILPGSMMGIELSPDGSKIFIARNEGANSYVSAYMVGEDTPIWEVMFEASGTVFTASDDGSTLVFCQYTGANTMWVINADDGSIVFDAYYKNQNPPGISNDGKVIVNGDYSGNVYLYKYDEINNTYTEEWDFKVGGGGTSVWVVGMGVSGDGNTVAVGTLIFTTSGGYDGEMYLFNSWSPVPLWVFSGAGDEIASISMTYDGSLIAACGWGPLDHTKPDFFLFRKQSSQPFFSIDTPGSFFAVDMSDDGSICAVAGKAVHAREMGSGGFLYSVDSDPDGGYLSGTADCENTDDNSNVKIEVEGLEDYFAYSDTDGNYILKYIPEGTYNVITSKVGYYPETWTNIEFIDGEETTLDFTLYETGLPPTNLTASHGSGLHVGIGWAYENAGEVEGFNIYRKQILQDFFPEEPIASVSNTEFYFEDTDVLPLTHYYYAVTAIIDEGVQSPYSNTEMGWMADGFVTNEISAYSGTVPVIDGTMSAGEWDDAFLLDASDFLGQYDVMPNPVGSVPMWYKVNEAGDELYVACINYNDTELEDHDEVALYIDDNNDGMYPDPDDNSEGNYWAAYYASGCEIRYRPIYNTGGVGTVLYLENPQIAVSDATGVIVYEFMIPIGEEDWMLNPNDDQSRLFSFTLDDPANFDGYWPCDNPQIFLPNDYGHITFNAEDLAPTPPTNIDIAWFGSGTVDIVLEWQKPLINDFDHYNIYNYVPGGEWEILDNTIGTQYFYQTDLDYMEFYVTTVDYAGQESEPSEIVVYDIAIGTEEINTDIFQSVYPNPSNGDVHISLDIPQTGNYDINICSLDGKTVQDLHTGNLKSGLHTLKWNGDHLQNGIYLIQLKSNWHKLNFKIVILE